MTTQLKKYLIQIINEEIKLGSQASAYTKSKAQKFLDELTEAGNTDLEFKFNGETYNVWNTLLCAKYDTI